MTGNSGMIGLADHTSFDHPLLTCQFIYAAICLLIYLLGSWVEVFFLYLLTQDKLSINIIILSHWPVDGLIILNDYYVNKRFCSVNSIFKLHEKRGAASHICFFCTCRKIQNLTKRKKESIMKTTNAILAIVLSLLMAISIVGCTAQPAPRCADTARIPQRRRMECERICGVDVSAGQRI